MSLDVPNSMSIVGLVLGTIHECSSDGLFGDTYFRLTTWKLDIGLILQCTGDAFSASRNEDIASNIIKICTTFHPEPPSAAELPYHVFMSSVILVLVIHKR